MTWRLLADSRAGRSGALVLSGAPGVGKSVLLAHAIDLAEGMRVLQAGGVETEIDLAFAGLHQLVRPVLAMAERLPMRQADALLGALGRSDHVSQDRFLVGALPRRPKSGRPPTGRTVSHDRMTARPSRRPAPQRAALLR